MDLVDVGARMQGAVEALLVLEQEYVRDPSKKIGDLIKEVMGKLGENIRVVDLKTVVV